MGVLPQCAKRALPLSADCVQQMAGGVEDVLGVHGEQGVVVGLSVDEAHKLAGCAEVQGFDGAADVEVNINIIAIAA